MVDRLREHRDLAARSRGGRCGYGTGSCTYWNVLETFEDCQKIAPDETLRYETIQDILDKS